ncbi:hypothetical protein [Sphingomonas sp. BK235]|uniref:hypothetical protein n=1 Tax=Sphingomonas sp. BK235 TaxID=2512131 RepID=UPI0010450F9C|nr:hypothetical protein [Sphingomonas sp. BK235]TCP29344.1 hypothetical protein EV292_11921 [Sphingomonas sp. BK235]
MSELYADLEQAKAALDEAYSALIPLKPDLSNEAVAVLKIDLERQLVRLREVVSLLEEHLRYGET